MDVPRSGAGCAWSWARGPTAPAQPLLHRVEDGFVLPTLDAPLLCRRALRFQRTAGALPRPVVMQLSPCLDVRISPGQLLAGRTTVDGFARVVDEILLPEPAVRLGACGQRHRNEGRHARR